MKLKKPNFWDYKKPNFLSYLLLPFSLPILINNFFLNFYKNKNKNKNIKCICIGNIYLGGTGKTPLTIKINYLLKRLNYKTATIKKFYKNQIDEQKLLSNKTKLYCSKKRSEALSRAIHDNIDVVVFDDGLQDRSMNYDLSFVCFNSNKWIGNGFLIPAGPLREKLKSISRYDAVFLNGNDEDISDLKELIINYNKNIKIFETSYLPININKLNKLEKYLIFSGIGNPDSFAKMLLKNNLNVVKEIIFPDHYQYTSNDITKIKLQAKKLDSKILTTEKDFVKLNDKDSNGIDFVEVIIDIKEEDELIKFICKNI